MIPIATRVLSGPRARADLVHAEQAFYEANANAEPWKTAMKRISPVLIVILLTTLVGLSLSFR
jgi:hypothetical protein